MAKVEFQIGTTPNPNSIRIGLSDPVFPKPMSFNSAEQAEGDALAKKLFAISGVTMVFMLNNFISVNKDAQAEWSAIEPGITQALADHFNG